MHVAVMKQQITKGGMTVCKMINVSQADLLAKENIYYHLH